MVFPHALVECHIGQVSNVSGNCMSVCELKVYRPEIFFEGLKLGDDFVRQGTVETPVTKGSSSRIGWIKHSYNTMTIASSWMTNNLS